MAGTTYFFLFRVSIEPHQNESYANFKDILDDPKDAYETMASYGNKFQLDGLIRKTKGLYYGTFCLLQTSELPPKVKFGTEPIDLLDDDDEETGLGHYTSFFYDPSNSMMAVQSNRNGISANGIAAFFKRNYYFKNILLEVVINPAELARLRNLTQIKSFEVNIAKLENGGAFGDKKDPPAFQDVRKMADETNANVFRLYLGVGYEDKSLSKNNVIRYVTSILRKKDSTNITKIEIRGREVDDENMEVVDLINNKVRLTVNLPRVRSVNRTYMQRIVTRAIEEYEQILPDLETFKIKAKHS